MFRQPGKQAMDQAGRQRDQEVEDAFELLKRETTASISTASG